MIRDDLLRKAQELEICAIQVKPQFSPDSNTPMFHASRQACNAFDWMRRGSLGETESMSPMEMRKSSHF